MVDGDELEADGSDDKSKTHEGNSAEQNSSAASTIDEHEVDPGENEVGSSDDSTDSDGVGEANKGEEERRVVHERVEAAELRDGHQTTSRDEGAEVGRDDIELLEHPPARFTSVESLGLVDVVSQMADLVLNLLLGTIGEDSSDNCGSFLRLSVVDELTRRFRAEGEKRGQDNSRKSSTSNHVSPATRDVGKGSSDTVGKKLTTSDAHVIETNHTSSVL